MVLAKPQPNLTRRKLIQGRVKNHSETWRDYSNLPVFILLNLNKIRSNLFFLWCWALSYLLVTQRLWLYCVFVEISQVCSSKHGIF